MFMGIETLAVARWVGGNIVNALRHSTFHTYSGKLMLNKNY